MKLQPRYDGIQALVGQGYQTQAVGLFGFEPTLTQQQQSALLKYGFLRKIVSKLPKASTAKWGTPTIPDGDQKMISAILNALDQIKVVIPGEIATTGVKKAFYHALFNAFLTGNGAIVIHAIEKKGENLDLTEPLDLKALKEIRKLVVLDRWQIQPVIEQKEEIEFFQTTTTRESKRIHASRVLWFEGEKLDAWGRQRNQGCDESILEGIYKVFCQYSDGIEGAARMLKNFDTLDIAIKGLWGLGKEQAEIMVNRSRQNLQLESQYNARIRDMENENITYSTRSAGGYSDLLEMLKNWMLANTEYPPAVLFGEFSTGLGASGKTQEERALWNDTIADIQETRLTHQLTGRHAVAPGLLEVLCACSDGPTKGKVPEGLGWQWSPLYTPTPSEQADLEMNRAQIAATIANLDPNFAPQYILSSYGGNTFNPIVTLSPEYKKAVEDAAALVSPPQPESGVDEFGNPLEEPMPEEETPPEEQPKMDSMDKPDPIDSMVRDAVKQGLKQVKESGGKPDRELVAFSTGKPLPQARIQKWRSFWRDRSDKSQLDLLLHGGKWGKIWVNRI